MVYRFKNIRTDFGLGNMPEDNIVYSRFDFSNMSCANLIILIQQKRRMLCINMQRILHIIFYIYAVKFGDCDRFL